jgi:hypothetical protein
MRSHVVISGTGRAGTSFLVELMTCLGLDTGFSPDKLHDKKNRIARAGLETDIRNEDAPYVIKNPHFCDYVDEVISRADISIEHVFVPIRDLNAAAESRRFVEAIAVANLPWYKQVKNKIKKRKIDGGLWQTSSGHDQEEVLLNKVYQLLLGLSKSGIPVTLINYPRLVSDPIYTYKKLKPVLGGMAFDSFEKTFTSIARPDLVHQFNERDKCEFQ